MKKKERKKVVARISVFVFESECISERETRRNEITIYVRTPPYLFKYNNLNVVGVECCCVLGTNSFVEI